MKQYIVDVFTDKPFSGNPAAVCVMDRWPSEASMMKLAMENNLSETAFVVRENEGYHLRWFTPGTEVELCGHATLASAFVILTFCEPDADMVRFWTLSGELQVRRKAQLFEMNFPTCDLREIPVTDRMEKAFGVRPVKAVLGLDLICVFENEEQVRAMHPDQNLLMGLEGRIQNATARGKTADCVSRSFAPKLSIPEDPVCGSAHCQIAGQANLERRSLTPVRHPNGAGVCVVSFSAAAGLLSAARRRWSRYLRLSLNCNIMFSGRLRAGPLNYIVPILHRLLPGCVCKKAAV